MSQLKKCAILLIFVLIGTTSYIVFAKAGQRSLRAEIESPYKWGKSQGPLQARIEEKNKSGDLVVLEGQVNTKLESFRAEWKLPDGVTLVSGQAVQDFTTTNTPTIFTSTITVKVTGPLSKQHLVFHVFSDDDGAGSRKGTTAIYNIVTSSQDKEKVETIQKMMKARSEQQPSVK